MKGSSLPAGAPPGASCTARALFWLTAAALLVRGAFLVLEPATRPIADERTWIDTALEILLSERVSLSPLRTNWIFYPPLYPYFIALVYAAFGSLVAVKWFQAAVSALIVPAVGLVGVRAFGPSAGVLAAGVAAFYPELVWFSAHFWSETLFMLLLWWAVERLLAVDENGRVGVAVAAGALWGLAVLTRETALYLAPFAAVWLGTNRRRGAWRRATAFLVVALLMVAPWTYRNWLRFGAFVPVSTVGALNLFQGNTLLSRDEVYALRDSVPGRIEQYHFLRQKGIEAILERQPWWLLEKLRDEMPRFWEADSLALIHIKRGAYGPDVRPAVALAAAVAVILPYLLALAGFVAGVVALAPDRRQVLLLLLLVVYNGMHVATHGFARYRLPVLPVVFLVAAAAWALQRERRYPRLGPRRQALAAVLAVAVLLTLIPSFKLNLEHPAFGLTRAEPPASQGSPP